MSQDQRQQFEAWISSLATYEDDEGRINLRFLGLHKKYVDFDVQRAWDVWQAAQAAQAPTAKEPCDGNV